MTYDMLGQVPHVIYPPGKSHDAKGVLQTGLACLQGPCV